MVRDQRKPVGCPASVPAVRTWYAVIYEVIPMLTDVIPTCRPYPPGREGCLIALRQR